MKLTPLTNRAPSGSGFTLPDDGWYHVAPIGEFKHAASGKVQVIDRLAVEAMANALAEGEELLIDFDHESHDGEKRTEAAGWIQKLQARPDGLYMQARWSHLGEQMLKGGSYRFISPVWLAGDCQSIDGDRIRPLRLNDAGLTNSPNLKGLSPLSNRAADLAEAANQKPTDKKTMNYKDQLLTLLGLSADASDEQIAQACASFVKPTGEEMKELENRITALEGLLANSDLDRAGITDEAQRNKIRPLLIANRDSALEILALRPTAKPTVREPLTLTNRNAKTPADLKLTPVVNRQKAQEDLIAAEKLANRSLTHTEAYRLAKQKNPAAFAVESE